MEVVVQPVLFELKGQNVSAVLITGWPVESESEMEANTKYMTSLLECSPYPLLFFTFDGHLITCNPAARKVFGTTIWLQSDIFGMDERERRGLPGVQQQDGSFRIERTERRTAYDSMMDALGTDGASFEVRTRTTPLPSRPRVAALHAARSPRSCPVPIMMCTSGRRGNSQRVGAGRLICR